MTTRAWVKTLTEDYIASWANKGLLRRGKKLLDQQSLSNWHLDENKAEANIDGQEQTLTDIGFENLECSCPAKAACHHLVCFLLGLKALVEQEKEDSTKIDSPSKTKNKSQCKNGDTSPWLIGDEKERIKQLGKANVQRALRWAGLNLEILLSEDENSLSASIHDTKIYRVIIPRIGGLATSTCTCKKIRCPHRAYAVLKACEKKGLTSQSDIAQSLDDFQKSIIEQVKEWINHILLQGLSTISSIHLKQGEALVTELQQADLPKLSRQFDKTVTLLQIENNHRITSDISVLKTEISKVYALINALLSDPLPQALVVLAGQHRRQYSMKARLLLYALSWECWRNQSGFLGYTMYFYAPEEQAIYRISEARSQQYNESWNPSDALKERCLGTHSITSLKNKYFILENCKCSADYYLSESEETNIWDLNHYHVRDLLGKINVKLFLAAHIAGMALNPYQNNEFLGLLNITSIEAPEISIERNIWYSTAYSDDLHIPIEFPEDNGDYAAKQVENYLPKIHSFMGIWRFHRKALQFTPILLITDEKIISLGERHAK